MSTNTSFAADLAAVASEFGVENSEKPGRGIKPSKRPYFRWTDEQLEQLTHLHEEGKSANEIAEVMGVSRDKVISKLAAMAARQRDTDKKPVDQSEPEQAAEVSAEPEQEAETEQSAEVEPEPAEEPVEQAAPVDVDRMIFTAFDNVVGTVDDFVTMSGCWRKVLTTIEQQVRNMLCIVEQHPNTEESVCQIAAIIAYDEVRA